MSSQNDLSIICSINKPRSTLTLILATEIDMLFEHAFTNALTTHLYKYKITRVSSREEEYSIRERIKFPIFIQSTLRRRSTSANYRLYDFHLAKETKKGRKRRSFLHGIYRRLMTRATPSIIRETRPRCPLTREK